MATSHPNPGAVDPAWLHAARERLRELPHAPGPTDIEPLLDRLASLPWINACPSADALVQTRTPPRYRRLLIDGDARRGYTALLIAWPPGHRTPLHDHDGLWGIELVLEGALMVEEFRRSDTPGATFLEHERSLILGIGDAVSFANPDYVHSCRNLSVQRAALSLHVYGGKFDTYSAFNTDTLGRATATRRRAGIDAMMI